MPEPHAQLLTKEIPYTGERLSVHALEERIQEVRTTQNGRVGELQTLQARNVALQQSMAEEIRKLRKLSDYVSRGRLEGGLVANLKEVLSFFPGLRRLAITRRSMEELLRQQYEISVLRVKEAAEFADRLRTSEADLHDEIDRLNERIVEAARNEDLAAVHVLELKAAYEALQGEVEAAEAGSTSRRELEAELDQLRRRLSEHSTLLHLYGTAEERMGRLKESSRRLSETIANLGSDIGQYVHAAGEKLDLVAGQIQAIGTAADAAIVMLEMKRSLDVMTQSMNEATRFVSETQLFFRQNLESLVEDLELYDEQTRDVMERNLAESRQIEEERIAQAVQAALERGPGSASAAG